MDTVKARVGLDRPACGLNPASRRGRSPGCARLCIAGFEGLRRRKGSGEGGGPCVFNMTSENTLLYKSTAAAAAAPAAAMLPSGLPL